QVGGQADLVGGPDAAAGTFASLEDRDVVPVDGEIPCRRQPGDAGADHQDLSRLAAHVFPSRNYLAWPRNRVVERRPWCAMPVTERGLREGQGHPVPLTPPRAPAREPLVTTSSCEG